MATMHSRGIAHLDIKPENIVITSIEDGKMTFKLNDFGLVGFSICYDGIVCFG